MKRPVIEFVDFSFRYASQQEPTLRNINLTVFEGEKILILGPSGSGKSTLANCINGLIPFSYKGEITGHCKVAGMETSHASIFSLSKNVGTVLQDSDAQFVGLTVGEDIAFALENQMMPREKMIPIVLKSANIVGMSEFLGHSPFELSGGQKQKVALGGVLNEHTSILLFDEPLASLDPQAGMHAIELIEDIHNQGKTVVIIEHRLEDVLHRDIDRVIVVNEGEIVFDGDVDDLLARRKLHAYGIREPLYLTQLEYAGCVYDMKDHPSDIETMDLNGVKEKLAVFQEKADLSIQDKKETDLLIEVDKVDFAYTDELVLQDVSFTIRQGEKIAFIGKNGAGKSTMAKLLTGIVRPKHGIIKYKGQDIAAYSIREIGQRIGYVMQNPNQMLVRDIIKEEVELALIARKVPLDIREKNVEDALTLCGLWPMRNWPVTAVSYGQRKRITVAAILALKPDVLILDEPTAGQDYFHYTEIMEFLDQCNRDLGISFIFITHDMHLAIEYTDRAIVFSDSRVIADDAVTKILSNDQIIKDAHLKRTSLYTLAVRTGNRPEQLIGGFIAYERRIRNHDE